MAGLNHYRWQVCEHYKWRVSPEYAVYQFLLHRHVADSIKIDSAHLLTNGSGATSACSYGVDVGAMAILSAHYRRKKNLDLKEKEGLV